MRDYMEILAQLLARGDDLSKSAADAISELRKICDKMTALGVDLEDQVAEQLQPEIFWDMADWLGDWEVGEGRPLEDILQRRDPLEIVAVRTARYLSDLWVMRDYGGGILRFYSEEEAEAARDKLEKGEAECSQRGTSRSSESGSDS